jgi:hypothetical protein
VKQIFGGVLPAGHSYYEGLLALCLDRLNIARRVTHAFKCAKRRQCLVQTGSSIGDPNFVASYMCTVRYSNFIEASWQEISGIFRNASDALNDRYLEWFARG